MRTLLYQHTWDFHIKKTVYPNKDPEQSFDSCNSPVDQVPESNLGPNERSYHHKSGGSPRAEEHIPAVVPRRIRGSAYVLLHQMNAARRQRGDECWIDGVELRPSDVWKAAVELWATLLATRPRRLWTGRARFVTMG